MAEITMGSQDFTGRIKELWRAGRAVHVATGDEITRYGTALQLACVQLTTEREQEGKPKSVFAVFHDRYNGFYQGLPHIKPGNKTASLGLALQLALSSKEQMEAMVQANEKLADTIKDLPYRAEDDLIFYFKSIDKKELEEQPAVMTLLRNCIQANMTGHVYVKERKIGSRGKRMIVIVTATMTLPEDIPELKSEIIPLPDFDTLRKITLDVVEPLWEEKRIKKLSETDIDRITESLAGFTTADAEEAVSLVWAKHRSFANMDQVVDTIEKEKARIIAKIPGLTYVPKEQVIERVLPGYESFDSWIMERYNLPRADCEAAGIIPLRGFALAGSQGTGKTEICKYAARRIQRILLIFSPGESKSKFVGDSEKSTRQVIQIGRATHAFIMVDDMDKGQVAKSKDYSGDGGTSGNQMQMLLTEMSDRHSPIIWAFTFNRLPDLPELFRPGRLDRCFYVERPNGTTRQGILEEGAIRANRTYDNQSKLRLLAHEMTADYSPAELIHVLVKDEVIRTIKDGTKAMKVDRMMEQAQKYKPQFSIPKFKEDMNQMEASVSQFERIGNRPEAAKETVSGGSARSRRSTE